MYKIDTKTKIEALNYATLLNVLGMSEGRLEPLFGEFAKRNPIDTKMCETELLKEYAKFFNCPASLLYEEFKASEKAFSLLHTSDEIIKRGAIEYPPLLAETAQAPRFLYVRGNKSLLFEKRTVSLVGSRKASDNAKKNTRCLAEKLGRNGITVISGLAKGIDVEAHIEALSHGYNTVAVIGTKLNEYYPPENKEVQLTIEQKGVVVSQFSPASKTQRWFFPLRNGVMSGLSLATVIVEAGETSGALQQAEYALKQGRQVIIPESAINDSSITWPRRYVQRGALIAKTPTDVLRILAENQIFKKQEEIIPGQQSLFDYFGIGKDGNSGE